jgi:broad specificity phosphatase PhoE
MRILLVRHGETSFNRDGLGLGREDVELTERGLEQARRIGEYLDDRAFDVVYASPLRRALETARAAAPLNSPVATDALLELDVGVTEGMPFPEMRQRYPDFLRAWAGPEGYKAVMPGGESLQDVAERVDPFLHELRTHDYERALLVTHNFVIRIMLCRLLGLPLSAFRSFAVDLASISVVDVEADRASVYRLNDTCHLQGLEP